MYSKNRYAVLSWPLSRSGTRGQGKDSRIRKSRYARFRASSVLDLDEDAQDLEALTEKTTSTTTIRQRGIYPSIIASVSLCFATIPIDRLQVQYKPLAWQLVYYWLDRATAAHAHVSLPLGTCRPSRSTGIAIFSTGPVRLSGAGPKVFRKG